MDHADADGCQSGSDDPGQGKPPSGENPLLRFGCCRLRKRLL
jgi:hypothetical protein